MIEFKNPLPYDIKISGSANGGFILQAGCCTCTFTDKNTMLAAIEDYINDPKGVEEKYNEAMRHARPQVVESGGNALAMGRTMPEPMNEERCQDDVPDPGVNSECDCRR